MTERVASSRTAIDMHDLGWFGQGRAFSRWIGTPAAEPYIAACAEMRRAPQPGEFFDAFGTVDAVTRVLDDPDLLAALAAQIEADYGDPDISAEQ